MDGNELKKLMSQMVGYMAKHDLQRIKIKSGDLELELEKQHQAASYEVPYTALSPPQPSPHLMAAHKPHETSSSEGHMVNSPIVGTFFSSNAPGSPAFVKIGDLVQENSVVCIIEAMKVMNEVRAGKSGTVAQIYVENGHPVEFGTKILRIV